MPTRIYNRQIDAFNLNKREDTKIAKRKVTLYQEAEFKLFPSVVYPRPWCVQLEFVLTAIPFDWSLVMEKECVASRMYMNGNKESVYDFLIYKSNISMLTSHIALEEFRNMVDARVVHITAYWNVKLSSPGIIRISSTDMTGMEKNFDTMGDFIEGIENLPAVIDEAQLEAQDYFYRWK
ncbi:MAG: hypothetical protein ACXAEU_21040 [Candidatus Hodarchaeales archaeon]|jgi:hypothetical protein